MMLHPPSSFIQYWKARELRDWHKEAKHRESCAKRGGAWRNCPPVPTVAQVEQEMRKRRMKVVDAISG